MKTIKTALAMAALFAAFALPGAAVSKTLWDEIQETAPLHPIYETLRDSAP
jgi:hypothetical protein